MAWFSKKPRIAVDAEKAAEPQPSRMQGLWAKCEQCDEIIYRQELEKNWMVCMHCEHHHAWTARARLAATLDPDSFEEFDKELEPQDPLGFTDSKKYKDRLKSTRKNLEENDAFISGVGRIEGHPVSIGSFVFEFMGGSMGSVVGEKVTRVFERAFELKCPAVVFSASGGARMQEGIFSLMQMAKTSAAIARFRTSGKPYVSVMLNPTTGGVAASFSWLGDIILAEPKALIGFAGPRVIEQTIRQKLPEGFQRSEFLLDHGMIDAIVHRKDLRGKLGQILGMLG
ncbi:acetyl-CoA carboxylase, carboxyltransferase subunit beta [Corallococcus exiguus]|uniref:Acetyl-coenzyme A carboxylase carboxyl transferase subunit beta n=1 Tax=Corallococcus exiguus TaxID=83462 RepID=A0A7X4YG61_9BACT|nr:acetyl-CoA carboxylase, carboxyltransferase subunit beta [Corallococcus exiguus]NBC44119.1 acetyl-CoA carboxylase carboxyltransferase subunit beta [Corallococcus exiguus]TNV54136.1 acetyl-CoA carboxylase carboxyltransferase subunit beta [Corallococcus exiguus]